MKTAELKRQPIMLIDDSNERLQLANKAESLLGYSALRKHLKQPGELGKGLRELGIEPFESTSVLSYQSSMRIEAQAELDKRFSEQNKNRTAASASMQMQNSRGLLGLGLGQLGGLPSNQQMDYMRLVAQTQQLNPWATYRAEWSKSPLSNYSEPVPEFVLNKAIEIKEKCPSATFFVDSLVVKEERRTLDPFLVVMQDEETYYVEVWDEPKFEDGR